MATSFVSSAASGANDGSDWDNAYTSYVTAVSNSNAGDRIVIDSRHQQTGLAVQSFSGLSTRANDPVSVVSAVFDAGTSNIAYEAMRDASPNGLLTFSGANDILGNCFFRGISQSCPGMMTIGRGASAGIRVEFWDCDLTANGQEGFVFGGQGHADVTYARFINCNLSQTADFLQRFLNIGERTFGSGRFSNFEFEDCNLVSSSVGLASFINVQYGVQLKFKRCEFTMPTTACFGFAGGGAQGEGHSFVEVERGTHTQPSKNWFGPNIGPTDRWLLINSERDQTFSRPERIIDDYNDWWGTQQHQTTVYRNQPGGAQQGSGFEFSYQLSKVQVQTEFTQPFVAQPMFVHVPAGSTNIRVQVAANATSRRDQFWLRAHVPSNLNPATSKGQVIDSFLPSGNIDASVETWSGSPTWQGQIDLPFTATAYDGVADITPYFGGNSSSVLFLCPAVEVT